MHFTATLICAVSFLSLKALGAPPPPPLEEPVTPTPTSSLTPIYTFTTTTTTTPTTTAYAYHWAQCGGFVTFVSLSAELMRLKDRMDWPDGLPASVRMRLSPSVAFPGTSNLIILRFELMNTRLTSVSEP